MNGTVHFAQNIIAFVILSSTSPVTYSIASLIKRVAVICIAIVWFNQTVHPIQALGIVMTFTGLYMYNNAKADVEKGEKKMRRVEAARELMLPVTELDSRLMTDPDIPPAVVVAESTARPPSARPRSASTTATSHYTHYQTVASPHANKLSKIISPGINTKLTTIKDVPNSYPSPPPSIDSPPPETLALGYTYDFPEKAWNGQTTPIAFS
jgi:solute carrier family 35 protein E1